MLFHESKQCGSEIGRYKFPNEALAASQLALLSSDSLLCKIKGHLWTVIVRQAVVVVGRIVDLIGSIKLIPKISPLALCEKDISGGRPNYLPLSPAKPFARRPKFFPPRTMRRRQRRRPAILPSFLPLSSLRTTARQFVPDEVDNPEAGEDRDARRDRLRLTWLPAGTSQAPPFGHVVCAGWKIGRAWRRWAPIGLILQPGLDSG